MTQLKAELEALKCKTSAHKKSNSMSQRPNGNFLSERSTNQKLDKAVLKEYTSQVKRYINEEQFFNKKQRNVTAANSSRTIGHTRIKTLYENHHLVKNEYVKYKKVQVKSKKKNVHGKNYKELLRKILESADFRISKVMATPNMTANDSIRNCGLSMQSETQRRELGGSIIETVSKSKEICHAIHMKSNTISDPLVITKKKNLTIRFKDNKVMDNFSKFALDRSQKSKLVLSKSPNSNLLKQRLLANLTRIIGTPTNPSLSSSNAEQGKAQVRYLVKDRMSQYCHCLWRMWRSLSD
jgi:hypothetical protein